MKCFIKKHYKKFLIFCTLFILSFTFIFARSNKVNAYSITGGISYYSPTSSYFVINESFNIDIPFVYSSLYSVDSPFQYTLSTVVDAGTYNIFSYQGVDSISSSVFSSMGYFGALHEWAFGPVSFYLDSILYEPSSLDSYYGVHPYSIVLYAEPNDTISLHYSFDYLLYNNSNSFSSLSYSNTVSILYDSDSQVFATSIFNDFINSLTVDYDYFYFYNINLEISTDNADSTGFIVTFPLTTDFSFNNYQSFIELNDFELGVSQEEIDSAYNSGFNAGVDSVDTQNYYNEGYTHASEDFLKFENLVFSVMNGFTNTIESLLDFEIFGISVFGLIGGLVACAFGIGITILIIKAIKIFT